MRLIQQTFGDPACDLALDELLLDELDQGAIEQETLRLWRAEKPYVVMGRSGRVEEEVHAATMVEDQVPLLRRSSGGGTIVADQGCEFFSLVLSIDQNPQLKMIDAAHRFVMQRLVLAIQSQLADVSFEGTCDLVIGGKKVSGNSLRVKRRALLYHGTLLVDMDLSLASRYLKHPPREPDYRAGRDHGSFLANIPLDAYQIRNAICKEFEAGPAVDSTVSAETVEALADKKYRRREWTYSR